MHKSKLKLTSPVEAGFRDMKSTTQVWGNRVKADNACNHCGRRLGSANGREKTTIYVLLLTLQAFRLHATVIRRTVMFKKTCACRYICFHAYEQVHEHA